VASPYHFHVGNHSRGKGHSAVAGAAYRAGEKHRDIRTGLLHNYSDRQDVLYSEIFTPKNAPAWAHERGELWNHVEEAEKRKDSRLAKDIDASLPWQLDTKHRDYMIKDFAYELTRKGLIVDANIHDAHDGGSDKNIHVHLMVTTRTIDETGFAKGKLLELDKEETLEHWRERWAEIGAKQLEKMGFTLEAERWRHGHRTMEEQKAAAIERGDLEFAATCEQPATQHIGRAALEIEARGEHSDRVQTIRDEQELKADIFELGQLTAANRTTWVIQERIRRIERSARIAEMKMELARGRKQEKAHQPDFKEASKEIGKEQQKEPEKSQQIELKTAAAEATKSGTAAMTNSTERIQEMIREREAERLELERSETNRRQRINRGLEL
jgi:MobA/MobL family